MPDILHIRIEAEHVMDLVFIVYLAVAGFAFLLYLPKIAAYFRALKKPRRTVAKEKRYIGIVVPARNESKTIAPLLESIIKQTYDEEFFDVNVIVKDSDDPTVEMAKDIGALVTVVEDQTCKGEALDGFFKTISAETFERYDAFVIVDADAVISENYLEELNNALEGDADIFVTRKYNKNCYVGDRRSRSLFSNCAALLWPLLDDLGGRWKEENGVPLNLCGQGLMVRSSVIEKLEGWPFRTLTEDYELRLDSLVNGFRSTYCAHAVLYTEEAISHKEDVHRRLRWLTGYSQGDLKYRKQIKQQAKERHKMTKGEKDYLYGVLPLILFASATVLSMIIGIGFGIGMALVQNPLGIRAVLQLTLIPFVIMYGLLFTYSVLGYYIGKQIFVPLTLGEKIAMLLVQPFYLLEFCPIFLRGRYRAYRGKAKAWEETKRVDYDKDK